MRRDPLELAQGPRMGRMAMLPLGAAAVFALLGLISHRVTEARRIDAVEAAVLASGRAAPVVVEPIRGDECWRGREGFRWRAGAEQGWACAGPGGEVTLKEP